MRGLAVAGFLVAGFGVAHAQLNKSITIDGDASSEWVPASDTVTTDMGNANGFGDSLSLDAMYVTWDATNLYVGLDGDQANGNMIVLFVDGNHGSLDNNGWLNTLSAMDDTSEARIDRYVSNLELAFPDGFKPDAFAAVNGNISTDSVGWDGDAISGQAGYRTWNGGAADNFGYDCCSGAGLFEVSRAAAGTSQFELSVRWDRVWLANNEDAVVGGVIPAGLSGEIGLLALLSNGDDNPFVSNQFLPILTDDMGAPWGDNVGSDNLVSTITNPKFSVAVIDIDTDDNGIIDTVGDMTDGRVSFNTANPPLVATGASLFYSNDLVRVTFSEVPFTGTGAEAISALNPANYAVTGTTVSSVAQGTGAREAEFFVTIADAVTTSTDITVSNVAVSTSSSPILDLTTTLEPLRILDVTVDSTGDAQNFMDAPIVRGEWYWDREYPTSDGTDIYPDVPGDQIEAGDIADDGIYRGRVFETGLTNASVYGDKEYVVESAYDFSGAVANGKSPVRKLNAGYWGMNFNRVVPGAGTSISVADDVDNRLLPNPVQVTITLRMVDDNTEFTAAQAANGDVLMYVQAGGTFGGDNAIPTSPPSVLPGEADVIGDGKLMTYDGVDAGFMVFSTTVNYPKSVPDVTGYRFGYDFPSLTTQVREEQADFTPDDDPTTFGDGTGIGATTVHGHIVRLAENDAARAAGRSIEIEWKKASFDVPAPPDDGRTDPPASADVWEMYQ